MLIFLTFLLGMSFISLGTDASRHEIGSQLVSFSVWAWSFHG